MPAFAHTEAEISAFLRRDVPRLLAHLDPAQPPVWGQMTAQHMVEHLVGALRLSLGQYGLPAPPAGPAIDRMQAFLASAAPFPTNIRNPRMPAVPGPLRLATLPAANTALLLLLDDFFSHYAHQPTATAAHPMFGPLDFGQWQRFHFKHFTHHLTQFGLLPAPNTN